MGADDCIYPDCLIKTEFGGACEHACLFEEVAKRERALSSAEGAEK